MLRFRGRMARCLALAVVTGALIAAATAAFATPVLNNTGSITGMVTETGTNDAASVNVELWHEDPLLGWVFAGRTSTAGGAYQFSLGHDGDYRVAFGTVDPTNPSAVLQFVPQWWDNQSGPDSATPIHVSDPAHGWDGIDAALTVLRNRATSITLDVSAANIGYGQRYTVTGKLNTSGQPIPSTAAVSLMSGTSAVASAVVGADGVFALSCAPAYPATFFVSFAGAGRLMSSESGTVGLNVRPIVGTPSVSRKPTSKKATTVTGLVTPAPRSRVTVTLYKVVKKKPRKYKTYSLACDSRRVWTLKRRFAKGGWRIRASYGGVDSAYRKLTIKR